MSKFLSTVLFGLTLSVAPMPTAQWKPAKHNWVIEPAQATTTGDKVEVVEVRC